MNIISKKALNILIVEDNIDLADILCQLLNLSGYKTRAANTGGQGLEKIREDKPDVIICDIGLPDMTGYELAKIIRKDSTFKDIFLIASSGYAQPKDIELSMEAGFDRHLGKPLDITSLDLLLKDVKMEDNKGY